MDCINHIGTQATAYCQNCGRALCTDCARPAGSGQLFCANCAHAWQSVSAPFVALPAATPDPAVAAALGVIPGVGAMYNGQFFKALIHVVVFIVIVNITAEHSPYFGFFIPAWILYQIFEAYHTARARRAGLVPPDPLGINELGTRLNLNGQPSAPPASPVASNLHDEVDHGMGTGAAPSPFGMGSQTPGRTPTTPMPAYVPFPSYPSQWNHREPIGAVVLIALGLIFLLGEMNIFSFWAFKFVWPVLLIGLGLWLIIRRLRGLQGGSK